MKVKHIQSCPICGGELRQEQSNPLYQLQMRDSGQIFLCFSPLFNDPLHYYSHTVATDNSDWIISQEFSINIGSRYVMFYNDYQLDQSSIRSDARSAETLQIPILVIPDFPNLENLKRKIKLSITFS